MKKKKREMRVQVTSGRKRTARNGETRKTLGLGLSLRKSSAVFGCRQSAAPQIKRSAPLV